MPNKISGSDIQQFTAFLPHTGSRTVIHPNSFVDFDAIQIVCLLI